MCISPHILLLNHDNYLGVFFLTGKSWLKPPKTFPGTGIPVMNPRCGTPKPAVPTVSSAGGSSKPTKMSDRAWSFWVSYLFLTEWNISGLPRESLYRALYGRFTSQWVFPLRQRIGDGFLLQNSLRKWNQIQPWFRNICIICMYRYMYNYVYIYIDI